MDTKAILRVKICRNSNNTRYLLQYRLPQSSHGSAVHGAMGCDQESFKLVWRCHQLLSGFLAKGQLPRVSLQSRGLLMVEPSS